MQRAGAAAAAEIVRRYGRRLAAAWPCTPGPGNNGGDAWVVAAALARAGVRVGVREWAGPPRTDDAAFERARAAGASAGDRARARGRRRAVRHRRPARATPSCCARTPARSRAARAAGARVVALDVPVRARRDHGQPLGAWPPPT
jgi:NAD(P)H-hydrate epimerase